MGNYMFGVERVMISHGHEDHVLGLLSLITARNLARGDHEKPLDIFFPQNDNLCHMIRQFIDRRVGERMKYKLRWRSIDESFKLPISKTEAIHAFPMKHSSSTTLGYVIRDTRTKLNPKYDGMDIPKVLASGVRKEDIKVQYTANTFAYCLDAYDFDISQIAGANLAVMDCTFLKREDRDDITHFTLKEAWMLCDEARVKEMVIAHVSPRYSQQDIFNVHNALVDSRKTHAHIINSHRVNQL